MARREKEIIMVIFKAVIDAVKEYNVTAGIITEEPNNELRIRNCLNGNKISVFKESYYTQHMKNVYAEYIVCFATQHRHFGQEDADDIAEYVTGILNDDILPLEFYLNGKDRFGGEIKKNDIERLSYDNLTKQYGQYAGDAWLSLEYEIRSWSGKYDTGRKRVADLIC